MEEESFDFNYRKASGRIDRLEVENFKSYKGHQQIGPFKNFTAIVGPNGSGKSNLMDAISFVLGVRTQQLRGSLKELLYSNSDTPDQARPRRGYVKLVYETEEGQEMHFSRVIQPSSADADATYSSVYKINDKVVTWDAYSKKLAGFGILVKVRNFLVFQVSHTKQVTAAGHVISTACAPLAAQHDRVGEALLQHDWQLPRQMSHVKNMHGAYRSSKHVHRHVMTGGQVA